MLVTTPNKIPATPVSHHSNTTIKQSQPSGYAASRINSSSGAENGTVVPCRTMLARTGSRVLGNSDGRRSRRARPSVCGVVPGVEGFGSVVGDKRKGRTGVECVWVCVEALQQLA